MKITIPLTHEAKMENMSDSNYEAVLDNYIIERGSE